MAVIIHPPMGSVVLLKCRVFAWLRSVCSLLHQIRAMDSSAPPNTSDMASGVGFHFPPDSSLNSNQDLLDSPEYYGVGTGYVNIKNPISFLPQSRWIEGAASFQGASGDELGPKKRGRDSDPPMNAGGMSAGGMSAGKSIQMRQRSMIARIEKFVSPKIVNGEENRGIMEPQKQFPYYRNLYEYIRCDLLEKKTVDFIQDNDEETAKALASSFVDEALPPDIFKCNTADGVDHHNLKDGNTRQFNCIGCKMRHMWGRKTQKSIIVDIFKKHNMPNVNDKMEEYNARYQEFLKGKGRIRHRFTKVAKDLGLYAYVWISSGNRQLPLLSSGDFKKLKIEGLIGDDDKNVYADASHKEEADQTCTGFVSKMAGKDGCCSPVCVPCHFAWINEQNMEFFKQQAVHDDHLVLDEEFIHQLLGSDEED